MHNHVKIQKNQRGEIMYRFFVGTTAAYNFFIEVGYWAMIITSFLYFKSKKDAMSIFSKGLTNIVAKTNKTAGTIVHILLFAIETYLASQVLNKSTGYNGLFGNLVGTGGNYFGLLICFPVFITVFSLILCINPLKEIDIMTMGLPVYLFFVRLGCFCQGCCWGIPWEYGLYNHHPDHPGRQVPVQLTEAIFVALIFIFLLVYRKKAKPGTIFPMYLTSYTFLRFFNEFFTAAYPDIIGPFNMYQILCAIGFVVGLVSLIVFNKYGEKLSHAYDEKMNAKLEAVIQKKENKVAEEKALHESEMQERLERAKAARAKAKARKK